MSYNIYSSPRELTSPKIAAALHESSGFTVYDDCRPRAGAWAGFGSMDYWPAFCYARDNGHDFIYGDHGYFGRKVFYRFTKNSMMPDLRIPPDYGRLARFYSRAAPWRSGGAHIILCPQTDTYFRREGMTQEGWIKDVTAKIRRHSDRKIIIHHKQDPKPLKQFLPQAHCVVVYSSNAALESVMAGVPAIATAYNCHVSPMTGGSLAEIEKPYLPPNRTEYAAILANQQWTIEEIAAGAVWRRFLENYQHSKEDAA